MNDSERGGEKHRVIDHDRRRLERIVTPQIQLKSQAQAIDSLAVDLL